jgi:hypothetical protein
MNQALLTKAASPAADVGSNMFTFLMARFSAAYSTMQCDTLLDNQTPLVVLTLSADGVVTDATINVAATNALSRDVDTFLCKPRSKRLSDESGSMEQSHQLGGWREMRGEGIMSDKSGLNEAAHQNEIDNWCEVTTNDDQNTNSM